jgi:hypothetical protein
MTYRSRFSVPVQIAITLVVCLITVGLDASKTFAQDARARLTVQVVDAQGATVPNANLKLLRSSTGTVTPAVTDATGTFIFQFLEPDTYRIDVTAPTFNQATVTGIVLDAYGASNIVVTLKPAATSTTVTVTTEAALLQTEDATRAWNLDQVEVQNIVVSNGNPVALGILVPGVNIDWQGIYTDPWTVTSQYQINGGLMSLNTFQIDGGPNDAELGSNTYAYTPPVYATKEFTTSSNNYDASYGHTSGGVVNLTTVSGGDKLHGMLWGSFRRTGWNANTFQNKYANAINKTTVNVTPFDSQTQLGLQGGGPLIIPKLITGRSPRYKNFYFAAYDHYAEILPRGLTLSYPTAKMRTGDFSELLNQSTGFQNIVIADPSSTFLDTNPADSTYNQYIRTPFPGNIIPPGRVNSIAQKVLNFLPAVGNSPAGQRVGTNNLTLGNNFYLWQFENEMGRWDLNVGDKYKFFVRPFYARFTEVSNAGGALKPGDQGGTFSRASKGWIADFVDIMNASTVLNVRAGYTFFRVVWTSPENTFDNTSIGYPSYMNTALQIKNYFGEYSFTSGTPTGAAEYSPIGWINSNEDTGTYYIEGDISKTKGHNNLRVGWDLRNIHFTYINPGFQTMQSVNDFTSTNYSSTASEATSGDAAATFLLGTPSAGTVNYDAVETVRSSYIAPWVQDDWRITPHLTLNLGARWDILTGPTDKYNNLIIGFNPNVPNAVESQIPPANLALLPQATSLNGGIEFAGVGGNPRSALPTYMHYIQPRIGFAWQMSNKMVWRGGYGMFYTNFQNNNFIRQNGFSSTTNLITSNNGGQTPIPNVLNNPLPTGLIPPTGSSLGTLTNVGQALTVFNRNSTVPDANEFSLGFQYRLLKSGVLDVSYVGNRLIGFIINADANLPNWSFLQTCDELYGAPTGMTKNCTALKPNPFQGVPAFKGTNYYTASTYDALDLNRPDPEFLGVTTGGYNLGKEWYNGLQVNYVQRITHGVAFNLGYVYSNQMDQSGWLSQSLNILERSPYTFSLPEQFKMSGTFELPFGKNRLVTFNGSRVADWIAGGWNFSPDLVVESGQRVPLPANAKMLPSNQFLKPNWNNEKTGNGLVKGWTNCVLTQTNEVISILGGPTGAMAQQCGTDMTKYDWLEIPVVTNERANPTNAGYGLRMKPQIVSDAAIQKTFQVWESWSGTIRLQSTNVLNHENLPYSTFDTNPNDGTLFGTVLPGTAATSNAPPRNVNIQVQIRF